MNNLVIRAKVAGWVVADTVKAKTKKFFTEERGGGEVVGAIIVIAIVVLLAVAFKDQLESLMKDIWAKITGEKGNITDAMSIGDKPGN